MHKFYYSVKDAWISETTSSANYGGDPVLELRKKYSGDTLSGVSRILTQFDLSDISASVVSSDVHSIPTNAKYYLNLYNTEASQLSPGYRVVSYPVSQSWEEGTGQLGDNPIVKNGVTWEKADHRTTALSWSLEDGWGWSGSRHSQGGLIGGGVWLTGSIAGGERLTAQQDFSYESPDIRMDVTGIVSAWLSGSTYNPTPTAFGDGGIPNNGFIIMYDSASMESTSSTDRGNIKFFSRNTHTIYPPKLEVVWDDHVGPPNYTSSFNALDMSGETDNILYVKGIKPSYKETEIVKFRVGAREKYPQRTANTTLQTMSGSFVADTSGSYSIRDYATGDVIVPFGDYSLLSLDSGSMYFEQDMNTFQPNRIYKILLKIKYNDGQEHIFDDNKFQFKVVR